VATRRESAGAWSTFSPLAWWDGEHGDPEVRAVPILAGHYVMGVLVERGRAVGARVRTAAGEVHDLRATRVVLAAGTMENSRLAMQAMAAADGGAPRELTGLVDKVAQGFMVAFEDVKCLPESIRAAARGGQLYHRVGTEQTRSNHFVRFGETATGAVTLDSWTMGEQWRGLNGRVTCENADAWPWPTVVRAGLGPGDRALRLDQQNTLRQFWAAVAERFGGRGFPLRFADRHGSSDLRERLTNDHPAPLTYSFPLGSEQHEAGTLPLGGFVDESDQQLKAVPGLYACGPAVFPRTGAANPSMTTLALSRRLGAILAG
jgi:choline dehydrogenase-like flavoprotein